MKVFRSSEAPFRPADPHSFVGPAQARLVASSEQGTPVHVYHVMFDHGARTNWHLHSGAQWLLVLEGRIRVQRLGEPPQDVDAGDVVVIAPGEKHWHGAAPGARGAHLAVNVSSKTEWLEPVSEEQYRGGA